jgi:predicted XRE-type DNA-binding protein
LSEELKELRNIKKLLILLLQANKVDQREIAKVLGLTQQSISLMLNPKGKKNAEKEA